MQRLLYYTWCRDYCDYCTWCWYYCIWWRSVQRRYCTFRRIILCTWCRGCCCTCCRGRCKVCCGVPTVEAVVPAVLAGEEAVGQAAETVGPAAEAVVPGVEAVVPGAEAGAVPGAEACAESSYLAEDNGGEDSWEDGDDDEAGWTVGWLTSWQSFVWWPLIWGFTNGKKMSLQNNKQYSIMDLNFAQICFLTCFWIREYLLLLQIWARNLLIGFLSESVVFCEKLSDLSDSLKKTSDSLIRSFLVSDLGDLLTSLIFGEWPERFTHIADQKLIFCLEKSCTVLLTNCASFDLINYYHDVKI